MQNWKTHAIIAPAKETEHASREVPDIAQLFLYFFISLFLSSVASASSDLVVSSLASRFCRRLSSLISSRMTMWWSNLWMESMMEKDVSVMAKFLELASPSFSFLFLRLLMIPTRPRLLSSPYSRPPTTSPPCNKA